MIGRTNSAAGSSEKHFSNIIVSTDYLMGEQVNCKCDDVEYDVTLVFDADGEAAFTVNDWGTYTITTDGKTKTVTVAAWYQEYEVEFLGAVDVTFVVEGAKGDNITIKDINGNIVQTLIFDSNVTAKQTTLTVAIDGEDFIFESSVAKDTTNGTINYSKTIRINSDGSSFTDILTPLVPTMTSDTTPYGVASASSVLSENSAWKAFDGNVNDYWYSASPSQFETQWIQYQFTSPVCVKKFSVFCPVKSHYATIKASNDGSTWVDLLYHTTIPRQQSSSDSYYGDINNDNSYLYYRYVLDNTSNTSTRACKIESLQFYTFEKGVKVMPDGTIYWYGNGEENISTSGWTMNGSTCEFVPSSFQANYINYLHNSQSNYHTSFGTENAYDVTDYSSFKVVSNANAVGAYGIYATNSKARVNPTLLGKPNAANATETIVCDISNYSGDKFMSFNTGGNMSAKIYAMWFE